MSLHNLVNTIKCKNDGCSEMVSIGRILQDKPRECSKCKCRRYNESRKLAYRQRYRKKTKVFCIQCGCMLAFVGIQGRRKEICLDCQKVIRDRYNNQKCIYCQKQLDGKQGKFCSQNCRNKTLYILGKRYYMRKKNVDKLES